MPSSESAQKLHIRLLDSFYSSNSSRVISVFNVKIEPKLRSKNWVLDENIFW